MPERVPLPTDKEIAPYGDLDGRCAVEHFLGKTVREIVSELRERSFSYQEDLMWMGPKAFCFYLPAFLEYLQGRRDEGLALFIPSVLSFQLEHYADAIGPSFPTIAALCDHLLARDDDYVMPTHKAQLRAVRERVSRSP